MDMTNQQLLNTTSLKPKLSRKQAYAFAIKQLNGDIPSPGYSLHHYGRCEIQGLLDAIYGINSKGEIL